MSSETNPQNAIMKIMMGSYLAQALRAVAKLRIADHFGQGQKTTAELATAAKVHEAHCGARFALLRPPECFSLYPMISGN